MSEPNRTGVQEPLPGVEITTYFSDTLVPTEDSFSWKAGPFADVVSMALGMYLLDLMKAHGHRIVSGVTYCVPEPVVAQYPAGWAVLRATVDVQEFDAEVGP
jgi:hypothetical protein